MKVRNSTMEGPRSSAMRSLEENEQPDDVPAMGNRYSMSRRVEKENVIRFKMWRIPQLVMKSWGNMEIQWAPARLEWCNVALAEEIGSKNLERDHAIYWG